MHISMTHPDRVQNRIHTAAVTAIRDCVKLKRLASGWSLAGVLGTRVVKPSVAVKSCVDDNA